MKANSRKIQVVEFDASTMEVRLFDSADGAHYRAWRIPRVELRHLVDWFTAEEVTAGGKRKRGRSIRYKTVYKTVHVELWRRHVHVRGLDSSGRARLVGWTIPVEVLSLLSEAVPHADQAQ